MDDPMTTPPKQRLPFAGIAVGIALLTVIASVAIVRPKAAPAPAKAPEAVPPERLQGLEQRLERLERARPVRLEPREKSRDFEDIDELIASARRDADRLSTRRLEDMEAKLEEAIRLRLEDHLSKVEGLSEALAKSTRSSLEAEFFALEAALRGLKRRHEEHAEILSRNDAFELPRFQQTLKRYSGEIYLVQSRFHYLLKHSDGVKTLRTGQGFGSGFLADTKGRLVTNKHVIQPWKFDSEIQSLIALGEVEVLEESAQVWAWPAGSICRDEDLDPDESLALHTGEDGRLSLLLTAEDTWVSRDSDFGSGAITYRVHALNDQDLALLQITEAPKRALMLAPRGDPTPPEPLDPVLAVGFPRGMRGLEGQHATLSPSFGTVRKIEKTIQVTAAIIPGNSGGPLFDRHGRVIGVATRVYSESLGIALKIAHVHDLLDEADRRARGENEDAAGDR